MNLFSSVCIGSIPMLLIVLVMMVVGTAAVGLKTRGWRTSRW
jgi:hypothetical protein